MDDGSGRSLSDCFKEGATRRIWRARLEAGFQQEFLKGNCVFHPYHVGQRGCGMEGVRGGLELDTVSPGFVGEGEIQIEVQPGSATRQDKGARAHPGIAGIGSVLGDDEWTSGSVLAKELGEVMDAKLLMAVGNGGGGIHGGGMGVVAVNQVRQEPERLRTVNPAWARMRAAK
jgi:hypothetical protein